MTFEETGRPHRPIDRTDTVGAIGERAVIAALTASATTGEPADDIVIGSGDDAAVLDIGGSAVISTDTVVEGRHFRFDWSTPDQVGARAVVQSSADVAAMGGRTTGLVVSIACPAETPVGVVLDLNDGVVHAAHELGARVLGGDLVAAEQVVVSVTAVGALEGRRPVSLGGARTGDVLAVSGPLGASAAGLAVLSDPRAAESDWPELVALHRVPAPDLGQGPVAAAAGAHAMTDISDGLVEELLTMSRAAGLAMTVESGAVPRRPDLVDAAGALGVDVARWLLAGGEDHHLLASFEAAAVPPGWTVIGSVGPASSSAPEVWVDDRRVGGPDGPDLHGWQSFADPTPH
ncbi:thiamine-phosphate kinase [Gordonia terrae]|uniref:Thiamine-monophosphate kinase n=1 Tax=Gordonia terrae TaxID=2055 RepID=A0A2I1RB44_9ACTN|nr:thiamine-phosphate kinase [Gordonia terrae]PKZ66362.1 thiamine-phosphate kinase [Gordonia terrae]